MVTDDLIKTRQAIFQQPDWLKACENNMALQTSRSASGTCSPTRRWAIQPRLVLWTTKDPSGPVTEAQRIASLIPAPSSR